MSNTAELHAIVMQQAQTIAKLTDQLVSYVQAGHLPLEPNTPQEVVPQYDVNLKGSDLVREHFRRGGGALYCLYDDESDDNAIEDNCAQTVVRVCPDGKFEKDTGVVYAYAVACCRDSKRVLTASELLG